MSSMASTVYSYAYSFYQYVVGTNGYPENVHSSLDRVRNLKVLIPPKRVSEVIVTPSSTPSSSSSSSDSSVSNGRESNAREPASSRLERLIAEGAVQILKVDGADSTIYKCAICGYESINSVNVIEGGHNFCATPEEIRAVVTLMQQETPG